MVQKSRLQKQFRKRTGKGLDDVVYWAMVVFFFLLPLVFFPGTAEIFELPKVTFLRFFVLLILAASALKFYQTGKVDFIRTFLDLPVLLFALVAVLSTIFSINPRLSIAGSYYRYEGLPTILSYVAVFFAATNFLHKREQIKYLLGGLLFSGTLAAIYGIFQHFGYDFIKLTGKVFELTRSSSTFGNPGFLGAFLILLIPIALVWFIRAKGIGARMIYGGIILILIICLVFTYTRAAWLGFLFSLIILGTLLSPKNIFKQYRAVLFLMLTVLIFGIIFALLPVSGRETAPSLAERAISLLKLGGSVATRIDMWRNTLKLIVQKPILGYGWETYKGVFLKYGTPFLMSYEELPDRPHNQLLYLASSAGILGWLTFFWIVVLLYGKAFKFIRSLEFGDETRWLVGGLLAGVTAYLIQEQFLFSLASVTPVYWLFLGIIANIIGEGQPTERPKIAPFSRSVLVTIAFILITIGALLNTFIFAADYYFKEGTKKDSLWTLDASINNLQLAVNLNPYMNKYRTSLAQAYSEKAVKTGNPRWTHQAVLVSEQGLQFDSRDVGMWIYLGDLHFYQAWEKVCYERAVGAYRKALQLHPASAGARWAIGDLYRIQGKYDLAIPILEEARDLAPYHTGVWYSLGLTYEKAGRWQEAKGAFQRVLELDPAYSKAREALARIEEERGE